jgi:hypothetical protein
MEPSDDWWLVTGDDLGTILEAEPDAEPPAAAKPPAARKPRAAPRRFDPKDFSGCTLLSEADPRVIRVSWARAGNVIALDRLAEIATDDPVGRTAVALVALRRRSPAAELDRARAAFNAACDAEMAARK